MANSIIAAVPSKTKSLMVSPCTAAKIQQNLFRAGYRVDFLCCSLCSPQDTHEQQRVGENFWQFFFFLIPLSIALGQC